MTAVTSMRPDVLDEVLARLKSDYNFKPAGDWLRRGTCPDCKSKELYVNAKAPWVVKCGRENKCGWSASTRDLYPDSFGKFNERFPATTQDPNATADAYMSFVRGFPTSKLKGWYRQGHFSHPRGDRSTATVVFDIDRAAGIFMERLIEPVRVKEPDGKIDTRKANFEGKVGGQVWMPPGQKVKEGELWLVEGCPDAIALALHGVKAAATLSSNFFPEKLLDTLDPKKVLLVWALDNDHAGNSYTHKHIKAARALGFECRAAIIPQAGKAKIDWNDCHLAGALEEKDLDRYRFHGDLLTAESALERGVLVWLKKAGNSFAVEHRKQIYWFMADYAKFEKLKAEILTSGQPEHPRGVSFEAAMKASSVERISNCSVRFLYFMRDRLSDSSWYYARVEFPHGNHETKDTFTSGQISSASTFKDRLLGIAPGAFWKGNTSQLNWIIERYLDNIKVVQTVEFIGYSTEHATWIFSDKAVSAGQVHDLNDEDFFEIGKLSIKSLNGSLRLAIGSKADYDPTWINHLYTAFGAKGIVAAAFWLGSLFAEQIREQFESLFFTEIVGEPGSGKTTLIEFLWKLVGRRNYEGFDPNKTTQAARGRMMTQVSNLPICMIESDRSREDTAHAKQFDWDELKSLFDGRSPRATGVKNNGNDTKEPPFRGSVVISQNAMVKASPAIMTRIVHLFFTRAHHTDSGKAAANKLARMPAEQVSNFVLQATCAEKQVMKLISERAEKYEHSLSAIPEIRTVRIQKNHGQAMAMVDALAMLVEFPDAWRKEAQNFLIEAAKERERTISSDHPLVVEFWEVLEFIGLDKLNHARAEDRIAINLPHVQREAARQNQNLPDMSKLKDLLSTSKAPPFVVSNKAVNSALSGEFDGKTVKCWIFFKGKGGTDA